MRRRGPPDGVSFGPDYVALAVSRDGKLLAAACKSPEAEGRLEFRDLPSGELRRAVPGLGPFTGKAWGRDPAFGPDGIQPGRKMVGRGMRRRNRRLLDVATARPWPYAGDTRELSSA